MSFGIKVGRAIGAGAALVVEGGVRGVTGLGRFGADVAAGAEQGFEERSAQLRITRTAKAAARDAAIAALNAQHTLAMEGPSAGPPNIAPAARRTSKAV